MTQPTFWPQLFKDTQQIVNVASVKHLSPFRYPGGKTWFVPYMHQWLLSLPFKPDLFIEPFAGGAIISLTVASRQMAEHVLFVELDDQVAAVWKTIFSNEAEWLCQQILDFDLTAANVDAVLRASPTSLKEQAFQTILKNRVNWGGILAPGAERVKKGENGKGLRSRWYPQTLCKRIRYIHTELRARMTFIHGDGMEILHHYAKRPNAVFFIDPPYTAQGKSAGSRLYRHHEIDHERLFSLASQIQGHFLMTYENNEYIRSLAKHYGFHYAPIAMKNTHHAKMTELVIGKHLLPGY